MFNFDDATKKSQESMEAMMKNYETISKGFQTILTETADFTKSSMEESFSHIEKLSSAKTPEAIFELQSGYAKSAYDNFVAQMTKMSEMYGNLAKTTYGAVKDATPSMEAAPSYS